MALFSAVYRSAALSHDTGINIILPDNCPTEDIPTVYLLHGMHGDHTSWCRKTSIERYAQERGIAVVMPDGENSFYQDMKYGKKHFTYVADELVDYTRRVFRLSRKREKTFICGLSMGGYGAFLLALRRPEQYAACASLSGCVDMVDILRDCDWLDEAVGIWGENYRTCTKDTDSDLKWLVSTFPQDKPKPRMFSCCGREDDLFANNLSFRDFMASHPFDFTFVEDAGIHDWAFWDKWVAPAIDHMIRN